VQVRICERIRWILLQLSLSEDQRPAVLDPSVTSDLRLTYRDLRASPPLGFGHFV
jgi:hypothetical protein